VSPVPYVRGQALVLAVLLLAAAVLGAPAPTLAVACVAALSARGLYVKYCRDVLAAGTPVPDHRERLDLIVSGDARAALGVAIVGSALLVGSDFTPPDIGVAAASPVLLAGACAAVYLSSLVDWYVILPRISGQLGFRPCRDENGRHPHFPRTWRETTRWWYIHRIAAALFLSFGMSFAITLTIRRYVEFPGGTFVVGSIAGAGLAAYRQAAFRAFFQAGHPTFIVGRTVRRQTAKRRPLGAFAVGTRKLRIPGFKKDPVGPLGPREYVYDIALEGVQLVGARERERGVPRGADGNVSYESDPEKVLLKHIGTVKPAKPFAGCETCCSGINWYCIENPRCFEPK
jgi:hypothetical protein